MPYTQEISRENKALVFFLLDQSYSMEEPLANSNSRKMDELAGAINNWLQNMVIKATGDAGFKDYMDVAVLGYRTDLDANPIIETGIAGPLAEQQKSEDRLLATIVEIANSSRIESRTMLVPDEDTGEIMKVPKEVPIWIDPKAEGGTPMCSALHKAYEVIAAWVDAHPKSFPPIVVHFTDGESSEGDPKPYAEALRSLATNDGNVLLFNCHLSMVKADRFMFPSSDEILPDSYARDLFQMSSPLPEKMMAIAQNEGFTMQPGARGMFFNAGGVELFKFLDIGTRVKLR